MRPITLGPWFPLAFLLGGVQFGVIGKTFYLPLYLPLIYASLARQRFHLSLARVRRQDFWVAVYCLFVLVSGLYAQDIPKYAYGAFSLFLVAIPAYIMGRKLGAAGTWSLQRFQYALIGMAAGMSLLYIQYLAVDPLGFRVAYIYKMTEVAGMRSNALASFHIFGLVATIEALRRSRRGVTSLLLTALLLLELAGGVALNSRAYLVLMSVPVVVYLLTGRDRNAWVLRFGVALAVVALVARPPQALVSAVTFRWTSQAKRQKSWRDNDRVKIWERSLDVWQARPWFGHGLINSFLGADFLWGLVYAQATQEEINEIPEVVRNFRPDGFFMAHNTILQLLIEVGVFGAVAFMIVFVRFIGCLVGLTRNPDREVRSTAKVLLYAMAIAFVDGLVEPNFMTRDFTAFYFFLVGLAYSMHLAATAVAKRATSPTPPQQPLRLSPEAGSTG